ncbi:MAG: MerR family transcriptional regulator [Chloroflexi bacterium]|nr:MerR family transcriptional regulator [Chloroflexota bacterium]
MMKQQMQIGELADRTGVSTRTIRYYIQEGLLPAPETQGKYTTYDEEYVYRLELIQLLKDAYLPLKEIRDKIAGLSLSEVRGLIAQMRAQGLPNQGTVVHSESLFAEAPSDWLELEERTYSRMIEPRPEAEAEPEEDITEPPPRISESRQMPSPKSVSEEDDAAAYLAKLRDRQNLNRPAPASRRPPMLFQEQADARTQGENWQRIEIAPGIELHVRQPLHQKDEFRLKKLIEFARHLF